MPSDDLEARLYSADIIGYLVGYAHLTNTRTLALLGDPDASAYELLFSFSTSEEKNQFLDLVRSNGDLGDDYIENDLLAPTTEEIRVARPLAMVLPEDVLNHAALIASTLCAVHKVIATYRDLRSVHRRPTNINRVFEAIFS